MIVRLARPALALLVCAAVAALAGCATTSASSPSLFVLDDGSPAANDSPNPDAPTLVVAPVATASYLDQGGIVYQTGPHRIVVANDNRWASSLSGQLTDTLYDVLTAKLSDMNVVRGSSQQDGAYRLRTRVDRFLGHYDGNAHITGRWTLVGPDGKTVTRRAFDRENPLDADGYPALVSTLSSGWQQIGRSMTRGIRTALPAHPAY